MASRWTHKLSVSNKVTIDWKHKEGFLINAQAQAVPNIVASKLKYEVGVSGKVAIKLT